MSFKLKNGKNAHSYSTEQLIELYKTPMRPKDKEKVSAVLRSRGVDVSRHIFLQKLAGYPPIKRGDTVYHLYAIPTTAGTMFSEATVHYVSPDRTTVGIDIRPGHPQPVQPGMHEVTMAVLYRDRALTERAR